MYKSYRKFVRNENLGPDTCARLQSSLLSESYMTLGVYGDTDPGGTWLENVVSQGLMSRASFIEGKPQSFAPQAVEMSWGDT